MEERLRFVARLLDGEKMAGLCREFGISRKTGFNTSNSMHAIAASYLAGIHLEQIRDAMCGFSAGLRSAGVAETNISSVLETDEWWRYGLDMAAPGDLLVLIPDAYDVQPIWGLLAELAAAQRTI